MGKLVVSEFVSLDGVMEAPEKWHFPYGSDDMQAFNMARIKGYGAFLFGRVTYEGFASTWPNRTGEFADILNNSPKFVVSSTLDKADWNHSTLIKTDVVEEIGKLKQQSSGNIGITGSATLVQSLLQAGLIDEMYISIDPIVVGRGKHLFKDGFDQLTLKLVDTKTFTSGAVVLTYQPDKKA
jgi:dihydrofolate reductase